MDNFLILMVSIEIASLILFAKYIISTRKASFQKQRQVLKRIIFIQKYFMTFWWIGGNIGDPDKEKNPTKRKEKKEKLFAVVQVQLFINIVIFVLMIGLGLFFTFAGSYSLGITYFSVTVPMLAILTLYIWFEYDLMKKCDYQNE